MVDLIRSPSLTILLMIKLRVLLVLGLLRLILLAGMMTTGVRVVD